MSAPRLSEVRLERIADDIKDAIDDGLRGLKNKPQRLEAARDLIEHIKLHHIDDLERDLERST